MPSALSVLVCAFLVGRVSEGLAPGYGAAALLVCGFIVLFAGSIRRNTTEMAVTTRRVVVKTGLASRRTIEMLLNKVETIEVERLAIHATDEQRGEASIE